MKIIENNYNKDKETNQSKVAVCEHCRSKFEYDNEDIEYVEFGLGRAKCPCCETLTYIDGEEISLTVDNIKFPIHFHHTSINTGAIDISTDEIHKYIRKAIEYFRKNKNEFSWYTEVGSLYLAVYRYDGDESYHVVVSKNYYETYIDFEDVDYETL